MLVHLTNGARSYPDVGAVRSARRSQREAQRAASVLGCEFEWSGWTPPRLMSMGPSVEWLAQRVEALTPSVIITHWRGSWHPRHRLAHRLVLEFGSAGEKPGQRLLRGEFRGSPQFPTQSLRRRAVDGGDLVAIAIQLRALSGEPGGGPAGGPEVPLPRILRGCSLRTRSRGGIAGGSGASRDWTRGRWATGDKECREASPCSDANMSGCGDPRGLRTLESRSHQAIRDGHGASRPAPRCRLGHPAPIDRGCDREV